VSRQSRQGSLSLLVAVRIHSHNTGTKYRTNLKECIFAKPYDNVNSNRSAIPRMRQEQLQCEQLLDSTLIEIMVLGMMKSTMECRRR